MILLISRCKYHGWQFDGQGACKHIPALLSGKSIPKQAAIDCYPCVERYGYVWVWPVPNVSADPDLIDHEAEVYNTPNDAKPTGWVYFEIAQDLDIDHALLVENLLDPAHVPFTHNGTIGKRNEACGMGMEVEQKDGVILGTVVQDTEASRRNKLPEMIFGFQPPCVARLDLRMGFGRVYHVNYVIPTRPGEVRVRFNILHTEQFNFIVIRRQ